MIRGQNYFSNPEIEIISTEQGAGAVVRPIINDGKLIDTVVINSGIGYSQALQMQLLVILV